MAGCTIHRFEVQIMEAIVAQEGLSRNGILLRLAWQAGLSRQELQGITWEQVDLMQGWLQLPGRRIALCGDLFVALGQWQGCCDATPWVLPGREGALPLTSISRLAQQTLQRHGLEGVRLADLRHDYIIAQLHHRSWGAMGRELAMDEGALRKAYGAYVTPPREKNLPSANALAHLLATSPSHLGTLAVGLAWHMGWAPKTLLALTWQQLSVKTVPSDLAPLVQQLRPSHGGGLVFGDIAPTTLSRLARQTLVPYGLEGVTLQTLSKYRKTQGQRQRVEGYLQTQISLTAQEGQSLLGLDKSATYRLMQGWVAEGVLVQVGTHYYHGAIVPPVADHIPLVLAQVQRKRVLYVSDVVALLHIRPKQCQQLLQSLVKDGHFLGTGSRYELP